jgi:hypothetical protein
MHSPASHEERAYLPACLLALGADVEHICGAVPFDADLALGFSRDRRSAETGA